MSFFGKLIKGVVDTALLPIDVAADVVTGFGMATEKDEPYTVSRVKKVVTDLEQAGEDAGDGDWV